MMPRTSTGCSNLKVAYLQIGTIKTCKILDQTYGNPPLVQKNAQYL